MASLLRRNCRHAFDQRLRGARSAPRVPGSVGAGASVARVIVACDMWPPLSVLTSDPDTGIDEAVGEVDNDVCDGNEHRVEDGSAHDDGVIALRDRLDELPTQPGRAEDRLDDDRACDEVGCGGTED